MADYLPLLSGLALGLLLVPAAGALGHACGLVDHPGNALKIHRRPVPVLGGVAVLGCVVGGLALTGGGLAVTAAAAAAFGCAVGVVDDVRPLPVRAHLLLQVTAGAMLAAGGLRVDAFGPFGGVFVIALAVCCMNAVNLIDGQDGLAGGLVAIASVGLTVLATGSSPGYDLGLVLTGSLAAFLLWNRPPARIFLGNGGAYAVGLMLAVLVTTTVNGGGGWAAVPPAALCLAVFGFELLFTLVRRAARGSLTSGDRFHTYDLLATRIGSRGTTTVVFYAFGALAAMLAATLGAASPAAAGAVAASVALAAAVGGRWVGARGKRGSGHVYERGASRARSGSGDLYAPSPGASPGSGREHR